MLAAAHIACSAPGRIRFKVPTRRRDEAYFSTVERELGSAPGVEQVIANPITASVLVHHRGDPGVISAFAEKRELFGTNALPEAPHEMLRRRASEVNLQLRELSGQSFDLRSLALLLLLTVGFVQLLRGQLMVPALTVFWYAAELLKATEKEQG